MGETAPVFAGRRKIYFLGSITVAGVLVFAADGPWWVAGILGLSLYCACEGADWAVQRVARSRR